MPERLELAKRWALRPSLAPFLRCLAPGECVCGSGLGEVVKQLHADGWLCQSKR